jgi:pyruvate-ferredoxin/flavodoxin oxidoreductase
MTGVVQNQDAYMKGKIAQRYFYDEVPRHLANAFGEFYRLTGRRYGMIDTYRLEDADYAIVGMGSVMETAMAAVDWMCSHHHCKVGVLHVTSFRPFPGREIVAALKNCKAISVIERMDNPLAKDNPLTMEIKAAFADAACGAERYPAIDRIPQIYSGVYGLGSRDTRVGDLMAVVENMKADGRRFFSLGISHETALERKHDPDARPAGSFSMRGHSVGGYGSVTTNKIIASLVEDIFGLYVQAYPKYGSDKKGLPTTYYLTVSREPIREHSELEHVEFVPINDINAFRSSDPLSGVVNGGNIFIQSRFETDAEVWHQIPPAAQQTILTRKLRVFYLDTQKIARQVASSPDLQLRMQGVVLLGIFLRIAPIMATCNLSEEQMFEGIGKALRKYFGRRGEQVIQDNLSAVRHGYSEVRELDIADVTGSRHSAAG